MKKKILLCSLSMIIVLSGCASTSETTEKVIDASAKAQRTATITSENIVIKDKSDTGIKKDDLKENELVVDAGDSKVLESTIDQITAQLEE